MKVIIKKTNEVKNVSPGYALNYLIPQGLAVIATEKSLKDLQLKIKKEEEKKLEKEKETETLAEKIEGKKIEILVKAGKGKKLFGAVTKDKIIEALKVDPKKVEVLLKESIKKLGSYQIDLRVGSKRVSINLEVGNER